MQLGGQDSGEAAEFVCGAVRIKIVAKTMSEKYRMYYNRWVLPHQLPIMNTQEEEEEGHQLCKYLVTEFL